MTELRYFDLETRLIAPDDQLPRPVSLAYAIDDGPVDLVPFHEAHAWLDACVRLFAPGGVCVAFNGAAFDLPVLWRWGTGSLQDAIWRALAEGRVCDPMYTDRLVQHAEGRPAKAFRGLAACCEETLQVHVEKEDTWRLRYQELEGLPISTWPADAVRYAVDDVEHLRRLHLEHVARGWIARDGGGGTYVRDMGDQCRAGFAFKLLACPGVPVDPLHVEEVYRPYWERVKASTRPVAQAAGLIRADGTADQKVAQKRAADLEARGAFGGVWPRTPKGAYSVADEVTSIAGDPAFEALSEYNRVKGKILGNGQNKGALAELRAGGRYAYRSRYDTIKETNRTGAQGLHRKGSPVSLGGSWHTLPGEIGHDFQPIQYRMRSCFRAPPGWVFIDSDFSQLELYTFAQICLLRIGWSRMADVIRSGKDLHQNTAAHMAHMDYDAVKVLPDFKDRRKRAKPFIFGALAAMGPDRGCAQAWSDYAVRITHDEYRRDRAVVYQAYPEIPEYHRRHDGMPRVEVPFSGFIRGGNLSFTDKQNNPFQSLGGSGAKAATWAVVASAYHRRGELRALGAFPFGMAHDQVTSLCPERHAEEGAAIQSRLMSEYGSRFTPDVPLRVETTICRTYNKGLDPVFIDGRPAVALVPGEECPHRDQALHGPWTLRAR